LITKTLIDQIEGEANIYFDMQKEKVAFATIAFPHFRGMETILKGKNALDALVITPRVCGICGHAHLLASVRAIEDAYKNSSNEIILSQKAQKLREFTLVMEIIQNHFKWLYLTIFPSLIELSKQGIPQTPLKGAYAANIASKAIALFAGQWPHSSYMVPGGITADPTNIDIIKAESYLNELTLFLEKETLGISTKKFLSLKSCTDVSELKSDISTLEKLLIDTQMQKKGFAFDRFIVLGKHSFSKVSKIKQTRIFKADAKYVQTVTSYSPNEKSYAYNAMYKGSYYETGPLARMMASKLPIIKNMHRRFKDSAYTRVMARVFELASLLEEAQKLLKNISIDEPSVTNIVNIDTISAKGRGVVEAPRGPLLHEVTLKNGVIEDYKITTPTQFNIGSEKEENQTPGQQSMIGLSKEDALFVFRTFDVCSVCTTH